MKELDLMILLDIFHEMLGPLLWLLLALAVAIPLAFRILVVREKGVVPRRLVWSELAGVAGGIGALALMAFVTSSGFSDAGGPVDWLLIALVFGVGLVATTLLVYAASGWWSVARRSRSD